MKAIFAVCLLLWAAAPARAKGDEAWVKPSASATAGSAGYWKYALGVDGGWHEKTVDPYGSAELSEDEFVRKLTFIGGVSKDLDKKTSVNGGLGFALGRVKDVDARGASFVLELGASRDVGPGSAALDYTLDAGDLSTGRFTSAASRPLQAHGLGPRRGQAAPQLESQSYNELSASYRWPLKGFTLILRETLGLPSYSGPIYTESAGVKVPFGKGWSATGSVAVDGGANTGVYVTAGLGYLFD